MGIYGQFKTVFWKKNYLTGITLLVLKKMNALVKNFIYKLLMFGMYLK